MIGTPVSFIICISWMGEFEDRIWERWHTHTHTYTKLLKMHLLLFTRTGAIDKNFLSYIIPGSTSHVCLCLLQNASNIRKKLNSDKTLTNTKEQADTWHSKISSLSFFCILFETQHFSIYFVTSAHLWLITMYQQQQINVK